MAELLRLLAGDPPAGSRRAGAPGASRLHEECSMPRRAPVAVTGIGAISPYGLGWEALLEGLSEGRSAIRPISSRRQPARHRPRRRAGHRSPRGRGAGAASGCRAPTDLALLAARQASVPLAETPDERRECARGGVDDGGGSLRHRRRGPAGPGRLLSARRPGPRLPPIPGRTWPTRWRPRWAWAGPSLGISVACASGAIAIGAGRPHDRGRPGASGPGGRKRCPGSLSRWRASTRCRRSTASRAGRSARRGPG